FPGSVYSCRHGNNAHSLADPGSGTGETANASSVILSHRDDCLSHLERRFADDSPNPRPIEGRFDVHRSRRFPVEPYGSNNRKGGANIQLAHGTSLCRPARLRPQVSGLETYITEAFWRPPAPESIS